MTYEKSTGARFRLDTLIDDNEAQLVQWAKDGISYRDMGLRLGVPYSTMYRAINKLRRRGVHVPDPCESRQILNGTMGVLGRVDPPPTTDKLKTDLFALVRVLKTHEANTGNQLKFQDFWPLPATCPVLGVPIVASKVGKSTENDPELFVTKDGPIIVSRLALDIMRGYTWEQLAAVAVFMKTPNPDPQLDMTP